MRELTKSMVSFSWSMSLLGLQQLSDLLTRSDSARRSDPLQRLRALTQATEDQLGEGLRETFRTGDRFQRRAVDMMFGLIGLRPCAADPSRRRGDGRGRRCGSCGDRSDAASDRGYADKSVRRGSWPEDDPASSKVAEEYYE